VAVATAVCKTGGTGRRISGWGRCWQGRGCQCLAMAVRSHVKYDARGWGNGSGGRSFSRAIACFGLSLQRTGRSSRTRIFCGIRWVIPTRQNFISEQSPQENFVSRLKSGGFRARRPRDSAPRAYIRQNWQLLTISECGDKRPILKRWRSPLQRDVVCG
jgi:hypothetical protein